MPPRRFVCLVSIAVHAAVIAGAFIAQLFTVGPLPIPHAAIAFAEMMPVHIVDIPLPAAPRRAAAASTSASAAPMEAPETIAPASAAASNRNAPSDSTAIAGVEQGAGGGIGGLGVVDGIVPLPPPPQPHAPVRMHSGLRQPQKIVHVPPKYPAAAQAARIGGVVILEAVIDTAGGVQSVKVLRSIPLLDQAAIDAVRQWRFTPTLLNGQPVPIIMTVTVSFTLEGT